MCRQDGDNTMKIEIPGLAPITDGDDVIRDALEHAHVPTLMNALIHLTGDRSFLHGDIRPEAGFLTDPQGNISATDQAYVRDQAFQMITACRDSGGPLPPPPDQALVQDMVQFMIGKEVASDYGEFLLSELALDGTDAYASPGMDAVPEATRAEFKVIVIGAGMSGLLAGIRLKEAGIAFEIYERHGDVGGTWQQNTYPGCRVDSPNHTYSYSFKPKDWPQFFSPQAVLKEYFEDCADAYSMREHIRFNTEVVSTTFDDTDQLWHVVTRSPEGEHSSTANGVITAVGQLSRPKWPDLPGRDRFAGVTFHSAEWDHAQDLSGKRVIVIGTGASAFQFAPEVAREAGHLTIFQRTPPWIFHNADYHADVPDGKHWLLQHLPYYAQWYKFASFWRTSEGILSAAKRDPAWNETDRSISEASDQMREMMTASLRSLCPDDELFAKIVPDYPVAGKRILIDNGNWLQALARDNVDLVTEPIREITETGVVTTDGTVIDADVLIYGTGFTASKILSPIAITGRDGTRLDDQWDGDARAYLGITIPNFPNLFCLYGPNTNLVVNGSIIMFSECEVRYVMGCLAMLMDNGAKAIDCRPDVHDRYNEKIDAGNAEMAWGISKAPTWYRNEKGRIAQNWPFSLVEFWQQSRRPNIDDYQLLG